MPAGYTVVMLAPPAVSPTTNVPDLFTRHSVFVAASIATKIPVAPLVPPVTVAPMLVVVVPASWMLL